MKNAEKRIDIKDIGMEVDVVNLTPHEIDIIVDDVTIVIPPSGTVARVNGRTSVCDWFQGTLDDGETICIPLTNTSYNEGDVINLPNPADRKIYIVSALTAQHCRNLGRSDLFIPTGAVRDSNGKIIGCRSLGRI